MIVVDKIKKSYGKKEVLKDISFTAGDGKCIGILGGNGSGKSTLLSILSGVTSKDNGSFLCDDTDLFKDAKKRSELVGYVPQGTPLIEELSCRDNLLLWYEKEEMEKSLSSGVLNMLGINDFLSVPVNKMSGGMKKRLSIGCAVCDNPRILLLDEPSAALDIVCKERIFKYVKDFTKNGGIVIISTHDTWELSILDELYILKDGSLLKYEYDGDIHRLAGML